MKGSNPFFRAAPFAYAQRAPINLINMSPSDRRGGQLLERAAFGLMDEQHHGAFDLCPEVVSSRQNVFLRPVFGGAVIGEVPINAYWCPYKPPRTQGTAMLSVPHVDLPKNNPKYDFMFTGAMNGCSLVVISQIGRLRVYHDSVHDAGTFANQRPALRLDYCAAYFNSPYFYHPSAADGGQSSNFLYYDRSGVKPRWTLVCQPLLSAGAGDRSGRTPMNFNPAIAPFEVPIPY